MADRFYGYQYDTNPRKISGDMMGYYKGYPQDKKPVKTTNNYAKKQVNKRNVNYRDVNDRDADDGIVSKKTTKDKSEKAPKASVKSKLKIVALIFSGFAILFAVSYQNSLISESFNRKEQYKKELDSLSKTNQQIEVGLENNLNLNNVEYVAKEKLGMQKLSNEQKIYVNLPKTDFVAPAPEQVIIEEDENFFVKLFKGFTQALR